MAESVDAIDMVNRVIEEFGLAAYDGQEDFAEHPRADVIGKIIMGRIELTGRPEGEPAG